MALRAPALASQRAHLACYLVQQVVESRQIRGRLFEAPLGAAAPVAVQAHTSSFLEEFAPVVRAVGQERVDHAALDHHTTVGTESRPADEVVDVAQAAGSPVQEVLAFAGAREAACDDHFCERNGELAVGVLKMQRHFREVYRPARRGPLEDDFLHLRAAQEPRPLLAEHPAHGIRHVRLATAIWTDDGCDSRAEVEVRGIRERLEAVQLELGQPHLEGSPGPEGDHRLHSSVAHGGSQLRGLRRRLERPGVDPNASVILQQSIGGDAM